MHHAVPGVFMAGIAAVGRVSRRVTGLAGHFAFSAVIQREGVGMQWSRAPTLNGMAVITTGSEKSGMDGWFLMAGSTL